ncbi:MAG: glycosyltransferase family 2 protein [Promethearchaeota archaeon]|jgi:glycosyltransferase involved in cell wall biosynthesis
MTAINQNTPAKVSFIIPTYNEEFNIIETLKAIKAQRSNIPYEIIVVDGQSTDKTVEVAKKYATVFVSPKKGKSFQLNYVTPKSSGELLVFLDADTIVDPNFLQNISQVFEKQKNLFACSARVKYHDGKALSWKLGSRTFTITSYFFLNTCMHVFYVFKTLVGYPELMGCNINVRREVFFKIGGFKQLPSKLLGIDKVFSDSVIYLTRKLKKGKVKTLNFISVFTSGRFLSARRSARRIVHYHTEKDVYYDLAKDSKWKEHE